MSSVIYKLLIELMELDHDRPICPRRCRSNYL